jgi:hypothetical protein
MVGVVVEEPAQGCLGGVVEAPCTLAHRLLAHQLHPRLEAVAEGAQVVGIEGVEPGLLSGRVEAIVADQAADQCPVLLLDVAVVVLVVGPRTGELDAAVLAVFEEVEVDELAAGVGMETRSISR